MPAAEAERAVSRFFKRLGRADSCRRSSWPAITIIRCGIDTWGLLAEFVGVQARGLPRRRRRAGS